MLSHDILTSNDFLILGGWLKGEQEGYDVVGTSNQVKS